MVTIPATPPASAPTTTIFASRSRRPKSRRRRTPAAQDAKDALPENILDHFVPQIRDVLWLTTADGRELVWMSPAAAQLLGVAPDVLTAASAKGLELVHPEDREQFVEALRADRRSGGVQEFRIRRADGTVRWIRQRTFPIRGKHGQIRWIAGIAEDVTAHRQVGDHLQRTLRDLATLVPALRHSLETAGYFAPARPDGLAVPDERDAERVTTGLATLTRRERQVHDLTVQGHSTKEIAATLGCSPKTVAVHRGQMMRKLRVRSVADLVRLNLARVTR